MNFITSSLHFIRRMNVFDVTIMKLTVFFSALWLYNMFPNFFGQFNTWFYFAMMVMGGLYLIYRITSTEKKASLRETVLQDALDDEIEREDSE